MNDLDIEQLLSTLVAKWKESGKYNDVEAVFLQRPSDQQIKETCPHGCKLVFQKTNKKGMPWREMIKPADYYRQTRLCRTHQYARIYVTTNLAALGVGYNLYSIEYVDE